MAPSRYWWSRGQRGGSWSFPPAHQAQRLVAISRSWNGASGLELSVLDRQIDRLQAALDDSRGFAEGHLELARLLGLRYQVEATQALVEEVGDPEMAETLRPLTSPIAWHRRCYELQQSGELEVLNVLQQSAASVDSIRPAVENLRTAIQCCPLLNRAYLGLARWSVVEDLPWRDGYYVERAIQLAPMDPDVLFRGGLIDLQAGRAERGIGYWQRSLALSPKYAVEVFQLGVEYLSVDRLAAAVLPGDAERLVPIGRRLQESQAPDTLSTTIAVRVEEHLAEVASDLGPAMRTFYQASAAKFRREDGAAAALLEDAVAAAPDRTEWRSELTRWQLELGNLQRAAFHAKELVTQRPAHRGYRQLLRRINRRLPD